MCLEAPRRRRPNGAENKTGEGRETLRLQMILCWKRGGGGGKGEEKKEIARRKNPYQGKKNGECLKGALGTRVKPKIRSSNYTPGR